MPFIKKLFQILNLISILTAQNILLRHQLTVMKRNCKRPALKKRDRLFWILACRYFKSWKTSLVVVKPETVIGWHRKGFRCYWRQISRKKKKPGRPRLDAVTRKIIERMTEENPLWGAPRLHGELMKLGIDVSERTVSNIIKRLKPKKPSPNWRTFLKNHAGKCAMDFFTVPTQSFKVLYVLVILDHERRKILHFNVTANPTAAWTTAQVREAFPWDTAPKYLFRDGDSIYSEEFRKAVQNMDIEQVVSAPRSPWQNPFVERVIGTIRRECLDHIIILSRKHLIRTLSEFIEYYNSDRTHCGLGKDTPSMRTPQEPKSHGNLIALPRVGGLHHRYEWKDAA